MLQKRTCRRMCWWPRGYRRYIHGCKAKELPKGGPPRVVVQTSSVVTKSKHLKRKKNTGETAKCLCAYRQAVKKKKEVFRDSRQSYGAMKIKRRKALSAKSKRMRLFLENETFVMGFRNCLLSCAGCWGQAGGGRGGMGT